MAESPYVAVPVVKPSISHYLTDNLVTAEEISSSSNSSTEETPRVKHPSAFHSPQKQS